MSRAAIDIVREFITNVRSGVDTSNAPNLMADLVVSHNIRSELPESEWNYYRTPQQFVDHVQEMKDDDGDFTLELQELFGDEEKIYARWKQTYDLGGGKNWYEYISGIYRVEDGKIAEYWLTLDRKGVELQKQ